MRTLGWALRNKPYNLQGACEDFGVPGKLDHEPTGRVTLEEIEYCRQDVRATTKLLNRMRADFDQPVANFPHGEWHILASSGSAIRKNLNAVSMLL